MAIKKDTAFPPRGARNYHDVLEAVEAAVPSVVQLSPMARRDPTLRASAAQMLVALYSGQGLTTPAKDVSPIPSAASGPDDNRDDNKAGPSRTPAPPKGAERDASKEPGQSPGDARLIVYADPRRARARKLEARPAAAAARRAAAPPVPGPGSLARAAPPSLELGRFLPRANPHGVVKRTAAAPRAAVVFPSPRPTVVAPPAAEGPKPETAAASRPRQDLDGVPLRMPGRFPEPDR